MYEIVSDLTCAWFWGLSVFMGWVQQYWATGERFNSVLQI